MRRWLQPLALVAMAVVLVAACRFLPGQKQEGGSSGSGDLSQAPGQTASPAAGKPGKPPKRTPPPEPEPPPTPRPTPTPRVVVIPEGTTLDIELESAVSSGSNRVGDLVLARLADDVRVGERVALRAGSEVRGRVTAAVKSGRVKGRARLAIAFGSVEVADRRHEFEASGIDITAGSTRKRDAALIGGGAVVGAVVDGKKGAGIGALLGGGAVLATKGKEVTLPAGTPVKLTLRSDLRIE